MIRFLFCLLLFITAFVQGQQADYVDFKTAKVKLSIFPEKQAVGGFVSYKFKILKPVDSIYIDAVNMEFQTVNLDENKISYLNDGKKLWLKHHFKSDSIYQLKFNYIALPKKAMYFIDWGFEDGDKQIWTQGQGKYTSNWLPSIDDMNDKIEFDLSIEFDKNYQVIANGKLTNKQVNKSTITWQYDMEQPMSSYLVALAIGKYDKKIEYSKSGISLEMYYYPEDSLKYEPTYRYTKQMFDFLEEEIGVSYPWQNYKQVPVKDFLYAGMENTSLTIFTDSFVIDSMAYVDKNYVNVNAHELAHQWFGDLVTETSGNHHWLQEGFATYYALLAEREVFGDDYYYWQLYEYAQELLEQDKAGQSTSLLDPKSSSTTFYKKGAWVLHMLREKVGDKTFKTAIKNYLLKHQFKNVETDDFIGEVEKVSGQDLSVFVNDWLEGNAFLYEECLTSLKINSKDILQMLELDKELMFSSQSPDYNADRYFDKATSSRLKEHLFSKDLIKIVHDSIIRNGLNTNDVKVRQAIAQNLREIPSELKKDYESLLNDRSYVTIEAALYNLCSNFPEDKFKYLEKTKDIEGFNNKNIRMLWIALVLNTPDFEDLNKQGFLNELVGYTSAKYDFETRETAFSYLNAIQVYNETIISNLINATKHHNWRFKEYSKTLLEYLKQDEKYKTLITNLEENQQ
ncbi:M1 family metallopeptidase [Mariniflexile soesokkakense]|uniref:Aminopeptidase N n=1 Tax=Mariniflexile soesokkakense TaxID=1343160 RepID=A0ABV0AAS0_9FLAO